MGLESRPKKRKPTRELLNAAIAAAMLSGQPATAQDLHDVVRAPFAKTEKRPNKQKVTPQVSEWSMIARERWRTPSPEDTERLGEYFDLIQRMDGVHLQRGESSTNVEQFEKFCTEFARFCEQFSRPLNESSYTATPTLISLVDKINREVNAHVQPRKDDAQDVWTIAEEFGDCEDYVWLKVKNLLLEGFDPTYLHFLVVGDENNEGHAVLGLDIRDDKGVLNTLVLDNKRERIITLGEMETIYNYKGRYATFIERSSGGELNVRFFSYKSVRALESAR